MTATSDDHLPSDPASSARGDAALAVDRAAEHSAASTTSPGERSVSRRSVLALGGVGSAVGIGAIVLARTSAVAESRVEQFNDAADALQPAQRIPPPTTTTPPTTVPDIGSLPPLEPGEILFPIIVGPDDYCWVSDSFGDCRGSGCSRLHEGVDLMADRGLPVRSPAAGRLTKRYDDSGLLFGAGNGWTLLDEENDVAYRFFHLDTHEEGLEVDDEIALGQVIGYVGNTGTNGANSNTNYHLHFEYRPGNVPMDSFHLLQRDPNASFQS
ncbi:MAG: M23 family metallopeptidase [Ilumatobacter sp.]|uniref:M23 family metallopeptidase n=1 Tax=Ilumatobacter sp. TaxID=1967498 RepID=UPI00391D6F0D